ncbi:MAG: sugar-binding protein [Lachnospiraceae bacterium]|nr:sugar-binding protein [Lachnospiraceae bacterium]
MKKKILSFLLAATMVMGLATGCGSGAATTGGDNNSGSDASVASNDGGASGGDVQVGIVLPTKDEPRWLQDQKQFETILGDAGFTNQVLFSQGSSATEKTNVETLISKGIKVLVICAQDGAAASAAVEEAKNAGVKVIAYDRLITGTDAVDYYVTFDSFAVGAAQGQYLIDNAPSGSNVPLYLFAGAATDNNAFIFFEGAWSVLQPKIADGTFKIANSSEAEALKDKAELSREEIGKIIGQITTDWDFNVAKSKAEANLTAVGSDMKGDVLVLAPNDGTARSIADVFASDKDVSSYVVTGQDSEKASVQYIIDGKQSMTVFKDTRTLAADSVAMAVDILGGKEPATDSSYNNEKIDVPAKQTAIVVVTKDNVKEALIDSGYYESSEFTGLK